MIISIFQAETGAWYVAVAVRGVRGEFKFDHAPDDTDRAFAVAQMYRRNFPIDRSIVDRSIDGLQQG